jgi:hypothetical protein
VGGVVVGYGVMVMVVGVEVAGVAMVAVPVVA